MFKPVHAVYGGSLTTGISSSDLVATPDFATYSALETALGIADHTYVKLGIGANAEIVKVSNPTSGIVELERPKDGTVARPWPAGTTVSYIFCSDAVTDMIAQNPLPTAITLTSDSGTVQIRDMGGYVYDLSVRLTYIYPWDNTIEIESATYDYATSYQISVNKAALTGCPAVQQDGGYYGGAAAAMLLSDVPIPTPNDPDSP